MGMQTFVVFLLGLICCVEGMFNNKCVLRKHKIVIVSGVEFFLRGRSIPTDGSGRLLITDISLHNRPTSISDEEALICLSSRHVGELRTLPEYSEWYLDPEVKNTTNTVSGESISEGSDDRGWMLSRYSVRVNGISWHRVLILTRVSETALEGKFTCNISGDSNNVKSLLILYPSKNYMYITRALKCKTLGVVSDKDALCYVLLDKINYWAGSCHLGRRSWQFSIELGGRRLSKNASYIRALEPLKQLVSLV